MSVNSQNTNKIILVANMAARIPIYLGALTTLALVFLTVADVVGRYFFNSPIVGATEITSLGMAVIIFTSLPVISGKGEHICVDLLDGLYSPKAARWRDGIIDIFFGAALMFLLPRFNVLAERVMKYGEFTEYLRLPVFYINYFFLFWVGIAAFSLLFRGILMLLNIIKTPGEIHQHEPL